MPYYRDPYQETLQGLGNVANVARGFSDLKDRNTARERQDTEYSRQEEGREAFIKESGGQDPETLSGIQRANKAKTDAWFSKVRTDATSYTEQFNAMPFEEKLRYDPTKAENPSAAWYAYTSDLNNVRKTQDIKKEILKKRKDTGIAFHKNEVLPALKLIEDKVKMQGDEAFKTSEVSNIVMALSNNSVTPWRVERNEGGGFDLYAGEKDDFGEDKKSDTLTVKELHEKIKAYDEETYAVFQAGVKEAVTQKNAEAKDNPIRFSGKGGKKDVYGFKLVNPNDPTSSAWTFFDEGQNAILNDDGAPINSLPGLIQAGYITEKHAKSVMTRQKHNMEIKAKKVAIRKMAVEAGIKMQKAAAGKSDMFPGGPASEAEQRKTQAEINKAIDQLANYLNGIENPTSKDIADAILKGLEKAKTLTPEQQSRLIALAEEYKKAKKPGQGKPAPAGIPGQAGAPSPEKPRMGINQGTWPSGGGF